MCNLLYSVCVNFAAWKLHKVWTYAPVYVSQLMMTDLCNSLFKDTYCNLIEISLLINIALSNISLYLHNIFINTFIRLFMCVCIYIQTHNIYANIIIYKLLC